AMTAMTGDTKMTMSNKNKDEQFGLGFGGFFCY
ncbi:hypothetical protein Gpo141_00013887, partial [Globisporangium polare]